MRWEYQAGQRFPGAMMKMSSEFGGAIAARRQFSSRGKLFFLSRLAEERATRFSAREENRSTRSRAISRRRCRESIPRNPAGRNRPSVPSLVRFINDSANENSRRLARRGFPRRRADATICASAIRVAIDRDLPLSAASTR